MGQLQMDSFWRKKIKISCVAVRLWAKLKKSNANSSNSYFKGMTE